MPGNLCEHCTAMCCRYLALPIDKPTTRAEYDDVRWYLIHEGISIFVEDGDWYMLVQTVCRHLQADHRCGIYATRPDICRRYTTDNCDYHSGDYGWEHHFTSAEHLDAYRIRERAEQGEKKSARGRKRGVKGGVRGKRLTERQRDRLRRRGMARDRAFALLDQSGAAGPADARGVALPVLRLPG